MNYWIVALPPEDMEHCIKVGTFGLNRKHCMGKVKKGDKIVCYITKECKIIGLGEAKSDYYMDIKKVFRAQGDFPDRFDIKVSRLPKGQELDFKAMVDDFQFITNKLYWSVFLRAGIAKITENDWKLIVSKTNIPISV